MAEETIEPTGTDASKASPTDGNPDTADGSGATSLSETEFKELQARASQAGEFYERLLRVTADFDNFKKRATRERDDMRRNTTESVLSRFLPVIDNFDMALAASDQPNADIGVLKTGVTMIHGQLKSIFSEAGLEEIPSVGKPFDPNLHEAVSQVETASVPDGHIVSQVRKGYRLKDRLIRPASVIVAKAPSSADTATTVNSDPS